MSVIDRAAMPLRRDSVFFTSMAVTMAAVVFAGFSRSFYLKPVFHAPPELSALMLAHGAAFTAWTALLIAQTSLIATNRRDVHRTLGWVSTGVAVAMFVLGLALAIDALRRGFVPPGPPVTPAMFFAVPFFSMVAFPLLVALGIANRSRPAAHKRYMILSMAVLIGPAIARLPIGFIEQNGPFAFFPLQDLPIVAMAAYDWSSLKRVHPSTIWSAVVIVASEAISLGVSITAPWHAFTVWLGGPA